MSYCRWSTDSDLYCYDDVGGGWTTHVTNQEPPMSNEKADHFFCSSTFCMPFSEMYEHEGENDKCWCKPYYNENGMLIHNSKIGREEITNNELTLENFDAKIEKMIYGNAKMNRYWMSFADPDLPEGEQFLGVIIIEARSEMEMMSKSHSLSINPGGEIMFHEIPDAAEINPSDMNRLLSKDEAMRVGGCDE